MGQCIFPGNRSRTKIYIVKTNGQLQIFGAGYIQRRIDQAVRDPVGPVGVTGAGGKDGLVTVERIKKNGSLQKSLRKVTAVLGRRKGGS